MKNICKWIGLLSIVVTFILPFLFLLGQVELEAMKQGLLIATVVWFGTAFFWIGSKESKPTPDGDSIL